MIELVGIIFAIFFMIGGMAFCVYIDYKNEQKAEAEDRAWLKEELTKPKYAIRFLVKITDSVHIEKETEPFYPNNSLAGSSWNIRYTSKGLAEINMRNFYEKGYFIDKQKMAWPTCNILKSWVVEAND